MTRSSRCASWSRSHSRRWPSPPSASARGPSTRSQSAERSSPDRRAVVFAAASINARTRGDQSAAAARARSAPRRSRAGVPGSDPRLRRVLDDGSRRRGRGSARRSPSRARRAGGRITGVSPLVGGGAEAARAQRDGRVQERRPRRGPCRGRRARGHHTRPRRRDVGGDERVLAGQHAVAGRA